MSTPKKKKNMKPRSERYTLSNHVANFFLAAAFAIFPLFVNLTFDGNFPFIHFDNGFILIRHNKYYFFLILTAAAVIMELLLLLTRTIGEKMEKNPDKRAKQKTVSVTDFAVLCFVMACALSTVFSAHLNMALYGEIAVGGATHGRNNGLILMLCYAVVYLLLTRCWRFREYVFLALAGSSVIVYLLAVLNAFYIDPLNMFAQFRNDENVFVNFMTTIGNKNMFSSHICVTLPVLMTMFVHTERLRNKVIYFAAACIGSMAAVVCDSDSVVLGMGAFAMVFLVAYARKPKRLRQFLLMLTASLCSMKLLGVFSALGGDNHKEMGAVLYSVMQSNLTYAVIAVLAALTVGMYVLDRKHHRETLPLAVPIVLGAFFGTVVLAGVGVILYFSLIDTKTDLGSMERTLRFSDRWGTHRGFMWNKAMEAYAQFDFPKKMFGTGPDTFYYTFSPYFAELYERFDDGSTDAAHNEYINYLLNIGAVGLLTYLAFVGSALTRAFKAAKRNPLALVFASAVVAYLTQAVVNIALPIATPLFIIFVSLCEATARERDARPNPRN